MQHRVSYLMGLLLSGGPSVIHGLAQTWGYSEVSEVPRPQN